MELKLEILTRVKNSHGDIIYYIIKDGDGNISTVDAVSLTRNYQAVTNATLVDNVFIANEGCHIDTQILHHSPLQPIKRNIPEKIVYEEDIPDFYGKDFIQVCIKIRQYASSNRIEVEKDRQGNYRVHAGNHGNNVHLFKLIESCGISVDDFVTSYLSTIQPFELEKYQPSKHGKLIGEQQWLLNLGYKVSMVIKIDTTSDKKAIVVSFHESNIDGNSAGNINRDFYSKPCAVIIDRVTSKTGSNHSIEFTYQHGFIRHTIYGDTKYLFKKGYALVDYNIISKNVYDSVAKLVDQVKVYGLDADEKTIEMISNCNLSFLSRGFHTTNMVCLLIDLYSYITDGTIRFALIGTVQYIIGEMSEINLNTLKVALETKFGNMNNELYLAVKRYNEYD